MAAGASTKLRLLAGEVAGLEPQIPLSHALVLSQVAGALGQVGEWLTPPPPVLR